MALNDIQLQEIKKAGNAFLEKCRPPEEIRHELDLAFRVEKQSVFIYEIRPAWHNPDERMEKPIAKTTYVQTERYWKVYWKRADMKWHGYIPVPVVKYINEFFDLVDEDEYGCFFG